MSSKPNDPERTRERMAELGRKSGEARCRRRSRGFLDALKSRVDSRPEELVDALLGSPPGAVVAARVLEKAGALVPEPEPEPAASVAGGASLRAIVEFIYERETLRFTGSRRPWRSSRRCSRGGREVPRRANAGVPFRHAIH